MGDAVPQTPWDLSLSFSRMDVFCFTASGTCRTIERLDRKTGLRRDATRAPIQARNGWRPHGRRLAQPATPSKNGRNFVQTMGSTSYEGEDFGIYKALEASDWRALGEFGCGDGLPLFNLWGRECSGPHFLDTKTAFS
jgi:hypothetical protein